MPVFSKRRGYDPPKEIAFREELPANLRPPIIEIVGRYFSDADVKEAIEKLLDPYGLEPSKLAALETPTCPPNQSVAPASGSKAYLLNCPWFQVYDVIEHVLGPLEFYESEFMNDPADPEATSRAFPFRQEINTYFTYAGIGWQLVDGEFVTRGDEAFEHTLQGAAKELVDRPTTQTRIQEALRDLSRRPKPDLAGAISHAFAALESVIGDIIYTPEETRQSRRHTFGAFLKKHSDLFPSEEIKSGFESLWTYANNEGSRHAKEGIEPERDEAELIVSLAAGLVTYLNRKHPK
jgi:hypothetical protein